MCSCPSPIKLNCFLLIESNTNLIVWTNISKITQWGCSEVPGFCPSRSSVFIWSHFYLNWSTRGAEEQRKHELTYFPLMCLNSLRMLHADIWLFFVICYNMLMLSFRWPLPRVSWSALCPWSRLLLRRNPGSPSPALLKAPWPAALNVSFFLSFIISILVFLYFSYQNCLFFLLFLPQHVRMSWLLQLLLKRPWRFWRTAWPRCLQVRLTEIARALLICLPIYIFIKWAHFLFFRWLTIFLYF